MEVVIRAKQRRKDARWKYGPERKRRLDDRRNRKLIHYGIVCRMIRRGLAGKMENDFRGGVVAADIKYSVEDVVKKCKEAHRGGSDFIISNLLVHLADMKMKSFDIKTIIEVENFVKKFK